MIRKFLNRLLGGSLQRGDFAQEEPRPPVENTDALVTASMRSRDPIGGMGPSGPPNWVPPVDEGRPKH